MVIIIQHSQKFFMKSKSKTNFLGRAIDTMSCKFWRIEARTLIKCNKRGNEGKAPDHSY